MNHDNTSLFQSNRTTWRRQRRHVVPFPCTTRAPRTEERGQPSTGSSGEIVRQMALLLSAAEKRIAGLERALEETRSMAFTDPLTGALNRRGFEHAYAREMARCRRCGRKLALALIDLDDFKAINDRYGHPAGDKVLVHLVRVLRRSMRPSDALCRLGGEEFALMLPETSMDDACRAVRRFLASFSWPVPEVARTVTFSAGVIEHDGGESLEEALQRADIAAYAAKQAGKNTVVAG
ncbi:MAG: GGDEF domain-containing protein [Candidatus Accumulibacter sp.]|jgi:diguanylate cyclase|nr:GGDEF domain-containing protein [Accumulibacter sp.]